MARKVIKVQTEAEVAIIGAGPAGAFTALNLAKLGLAQKTVIFEEHEQVGIPSHCAGHLNIKTLKGLGLKLPSNIIENEIRGAIFYSPSGLSFRVERKDPVTLVVNRELFDKIIAEEAEKLGVKLHLKWKVKELLVKKGKVSGLIVYNADKKINRKLKSKLVIDAEGCPASLLKRANFPFPSPETFVYGCQAEIDKIKDVEENIVEVYLGEKFAPGFFAWIIPKRDGTAKIGLASKYGNPRSFFSKFIYNHPIASRKLSKGRILKMSFHPIPLGGPIPKTFSDGLLVVGDAASQAKPTTGGGVITGMICAKIAAETAVKAFELNNFSEKILAEYQNMWMEKLDFNLKVMLKLRKALNKLSDKQVDKLFKLCIKADLNKTLEKVGDVDFQGETLLRVALNPKNLIPLLYLAWMAITGR